MNKQKRQKGEKGYLNWQRKYAAIRTAVLFLLCLAIFLTGYISTGSNKNLLTVVAVLGCLPACRSAVNMIMILKYHGISDADYEKIRQHTGSCAVLANLVFTSYDKNFEIHHMAFKGNSLVGYTANAACDAKACEKHLHGMCAQNRLGDVDIKIFKELPKYVNRLDQMQDLPDYEAESVEEGEAPAPKADLVCALMRAVSL